MLNKSLEPTGCIELDELIGGGYPRQMITQIYGEPGSGKSTISLMAAVTVLQSGRSVIYIDTESFSVDRFTQISGDLAEILAERLYLFEPVDYDQQIAMVGEASELLKIKEIGLVVMDSATSLYRTELEHGADTMKRQNRQMVLLLGYAKRYDLPVLVTNQVYIDPSKGDFFPLGGTILSHLSKIVLRIDRSNGLRRIRVVKHHARPEGGYLEFSMVQTGIKVETGPIFLTDEKSRR